MRRRGAAEAGGDPVAQLLGGLAAEGQGEHRLGRGAAVLDAVDDRLDQRRGLAGAGTGQHEQRTAGVVDDAPAGTRRGRAAAPARASGAHQPVASSRRRSLSPRHPNTCRRQHGTAGLTAVAHGLPEGARHVDPTGRTQRGALVEVVRPGLVAVARRQRPVRAYDAPPGHRPTEAATSPGRPGGAAGPDVRRRWRRRSSPDPAGPARRATSTASTYSSGSTRPMIAARRHT